MIDSLLYPYPFASRSPIRGPRSPLIIPLNSSTLISEKQQTLPPFSQLTRASLSPPLMPALSRISFGRIICPRSSTVIRDSTRQPPKSAGGAAQHDFPAFLSISSPLSVIRRCNIIIYYH